MAGEVPPVYQCLACGGIISAQSHTSLCIHTWGFITHCITNKMCMHNEVWSCAEIFPGRIDAKYPDIQQNENFVIRNGKVCLGSNNLLLICSKEGPQSFTRQFPQSLPSYDKNEQCVSFISIQT